MKYKLNLNSFDCARCGKKVMGKNTGVSTIMRVEFNLKPGTTLCESCTTPEEKGLINLRTGQILRGEI